MLIMVTGTINQAVGDEDLAAVEAWLGPMVDAGFLQQGYVNHDRTLLWFIVTAGDVDNAAERFADLPVSEKVTLNFYPARGIRFT